MKEKQELLVDGHRYPIYRYHGHFHRDLETKKLDMTLALSIPTDNIAPISPWIMQEKERKDVTIIRYLSKNRKAFKTIFVDFIGVRCMGHYEEYDIKREEVVLHLTAAFDNRIITNEGQQQKITDLLT